ncbi:MAG TPA: hypothetical protein VGU65_14655 [Frateuria sp.]|uniref:hypothetical protein n=1 Tax=Frateuria sp. TaxID=2211372 RepID=UPI002DE217F7|nr:hypothetical protein [Frateuria sp.]
MYDALDVAPPFPHPAVRPPALGALPRSRGRRLFQREALDDWEGACRGIAPRG